MVQTRMTNLRGDVLVVTRTESRCAACGRPLGAQLAVGEVRAGMGLCLACLTLLQTWMNGQRGSDA